MDQKIKKRAGKYGNNIPKIWKQIEVPEYHLYPAKKELEDILSKEANGVKLTDQEIIRKQEIREGGFTHFNKNDY